jgi:hypothetical protein
MKTGTAIGLLVGGAVLLLAAKPRAPGYAPAPGTMPGQQPGGMLNPFNWFGAGGGQNLQSQIFGQPGAAPYAPAAAYSPYAMGIMSGQSFLPGAGAPANYAPAQPAYAQQPGLIPATYTPPAATGLYDTGGFGTGGYQTASYATPAAPFSSPQYVT